MIEDDRKKVVERRAEKMSFTIYARMKKLGKQKKADIVPVPFVLEKKPECVRDLLDGLVRLGRSEERRVGKEC